MIDELSDVRAVDAQSSTDRYLEEQKPKGRKGKPKSPLDSDAARKRQQRLLNWYQQEREIQAPNRYQMAVDCDYYDNLQWSDSEAQEVADRGQAPIVFNETAASIDWIIGTEKRTRVDFKVLPRAEDDVKTADAKQKVLKWNSDVNNTAFARSLAFEDCVKAGLGWLEDGARGDPTEEPVFSRYESWRNILHDSKAERDLNDARFLFRIKWVDVDVALAMFPERQAQIKQAATAEHMWGREEDEDLWYLGQHFQSRDAMGHVVDYRTYLSDASIVINRRERVKLIEAWYREPERCQVCHGDVFDGERYDPKNKLMKTAVEHGVVSLYDQIKLNVRVAVMTEGDLLQDMASPYKHNRFPFTPIWCYRRGRDGMPYGAIRRVRDVQDDLNKRASKALFILSTNRVIADMDAVEDHDEAREEVARPDAYIIKKRGSEFKIENQTQLAEEHLMMMERDARLIRNVGGVTDDNLGRASNAISGEAIKARQLQGSVVTASIFDNLRYAVKLQGEIQLSLVEQFVTEPKVVRLTGSRDKLEWVKVNQPEQDAQGNWRFVNDITATKADFTVDEQDFHQSVRQAMFETMVDLVGKIAAVNTEAALRILKMSLEFSDLPNKDEMASEIAQILGLEEDVNPKDMNPQQRQAYEARQKSKQMQAQVQQQQVMNQLNEQAAEVKKTLAEAQKLLADAERAKAQAAEAAASAQLHKMDTAARAVEIRQSQAEGVEGGTKEIAQNMAKVMDSMGETTGNALRSLGELLAGQQEKRSAELQKMIDQLAQGQSQIVQTQKRLLEAVSADHEIDMRFENGEIVGATKRVRPKAALQ